jgi:hypothetical protein
LFGALKNSSRINTIGTNSRKTLSRDHSPGEIVGAGGVGSAAGFTGHCQQFVVAGTRQLGRLCTAPERQRGV